MRLVFALFFSCAIVAGGAVAQDMPPEGSTIKEKLVLGRSTFALPPGDWTVVATAEGEVTRNSIKLAGTVSAYVVQLDAQGGFVAAMFHRAPTSSHNASSWNDALCDNKHTLHHDAFAKRFDFPECMRLNHVIGYYGASQLPASVSAMDRKIWEWFRANKVRIPLAVLNAAYVKYFSGDYVYLGLIVNPEAFGQEKAVKRNWVESEWDPLTYDHDPNRKAFVENLKKWAYVMADNARSTLRDRKPKAAMLPPLEELRVK